MQPQPMPPAAAWRHVDAREGFEVLFAEPRGDGWRFGGTTTAVEEGETWTFAYDIDVDARWHTERARLAVRSGSQRLARTVEADGEGHWRVDGAPAPELDGCLDLDLEASSFTNAFPVRRMQLAPGEAAQAPAAWVRVPGLALERLEQRYARRPAGGPGASYDYESPGVGFACELTYDPAGLVLDYPGIAVRVA